MLKFVRVLAFAELMGGCLWLWPALFPQRLDMDETLRQFSAGEQLHDPPSVSPFMGLALIGSGTVTLALAEIAGRITIREYTAPGA